MQGYAADDQYQHDVVFNIRNLELIEHKGREEKYEGERKACRVAPSYKYESIGRN